MCGYKDTLFFAKCDDMVNTYRYNIKTGETSNAIDLKKKTGKDKDYAGIDCFGEKYLIVTYYNHDELLVLNRDTPHLDVLNTLKI